MRLISIEIINKMNTTEGQTPEFDAAWDYALDKLEENNKELTSNCPQSLKEFIKNIVLFNCPTFSRSDGLTEYTFVVANPEEQKIYFLNYELVGNIEIYNHDGPAFLKDDPPMWLYDEIHKCENHYEHHIVFSDGKEYLIPFVFFNYRFTDWFKD